MKTKLINKYTQSHLAFIHKGLLEENEIEAFIFGNNFMSMVPIYSGILNAGIELRVKEDEYESALKILQFENADKMVCMNCGSENIEFSFGNKAKSNFLFSIFSAILAAIPFGNIQRHYFCKDCNFKIKD